MNVYLCTENKEETGNFITSIKKQSAGLKVLHVTGEDFASKTANPENFVEIMDEYQKFDVLIFEGADYLKRSFLGEIAFNELVKKYVNNGKRLVITSLDFPWEYSGFKSFVNENFCKKFKLLFLNSNGEYSVIDDECKFRSIGNLISF